MCEGGRAGGLDGSICQGGVAGGVIIGPRPSYGPEGGDKVEVMELGEGGGAEEDEESEDAALSA